MRSSQENFKQYLSQTIQGQGPSSARSVSYVTIQGGEPLTSSQTLIKSSERKSVVIDQSEENYRKSVAEGFRSDL